MPYQNPKELFVAICDAIREKDGISGKIPHKSIPDYILAINLKLEVASLADAHYWEKYTSGSVVEESAVEDYRLSNYSNLTGSTSYGLTHYADEIEVVNGVISLVDPVSREGTDLTTLAGKYIQHGSDFYRIPADAKISRHQGTYNIAIEVDLVYKLAAEAGGTFVGYVISDKREDYPDNGVQGGYTYVYMGTLSPGSGGVQLPTLENPGTADDLVEGKELIGPDGEIVRGNIQLSVGLMYSGVEPEFSEDGKAYAKAKVSNTITLQSGSEISMSLDLEKWTGGSY